jgi:hypothetical protein
LMRVRAFADDLVDYAAGALVAPRRCLASPLIAAHGRSGGVA